MAEKTRQSGALGPERISKEGLVIHGDGQDLFVFFDGLKIAKRGQPGTQYAGVWVPLALGYTVRDSGEGGSIEVEYEGVRVH